jgi:transcriptional enhancer factor
MKIRKSWKTLKGNAEPVWPPRLEATMLKGLQEYGPVHSREAHILSRFPQRNQFISDYIYRKTGKYRSSKQIGSRLQQFKDTSEGRELIDSLQYHNARNEVDHSSRRFSTHSHVFEDEFNHSPSSLYSNSSTSSSDSSSTCSSTGSSISSGQYRDMPSSKRNRLPDTRTPVYIDILPESSSYSSSFSSRSRAPFSSPHKPRQDVAAHTSSDTPRPIRDIDSTITFVSPSTVVGKSSYIVLLDGAPIHSEDTKLECLGPYFTGSSGDGSLLYSTALVPRYWETLCKSPDPTVYTIIQDVYRTSDSEIPARSSGRPRPVPIFSATYHFRYHVPVRIPTPSMSPHFAYSRLPANTIQTSPDPLNSICPLPFQNYTVSPNFSEQERLQVQSHEYSTQSRLEEPFILNGSLDDFCLDDFMTNFYDSQDTTHWHNDMVPQSSSSFQEDICNYMNNLPKEGDLLLASPQNCLEYYVE